MIPVPPDFVDALAYSHWAGSRVTLTWPDGWRPDSLVLAVDGKVDQDYGARVRRTATCSLAVGWTTTTRELRDLAEQMVARGARLLLERSIRLLDGREHWTRLGLMRIGGAKAQIPAGRIALDAGDLGAALEDDRFLTPRDQPASPSRLAVLRALIAETLPGVPVSVDPGVVDSPMPATVWDEDRAGACHEIARSLGAALAADTIGGFQLTMPRTIPDWVIDSGGVLQDLTMAADREATYNAVRAAGETTDTGAGEVAPVGIAYDLDPNSPTRWNGSFGRKPRFYSSPLLTTAAQCRNAAVSILAESTGLTRSLELTTVAHPGLEAGDLITLDAGDLVEDHHIDTVTIPLGAGTLKAKTRVIRTSTRAAA